MPVPALVAVLCCAGESLEDHSPRQAQSQDKICRISGASHTVMTRMSRHSVVAPILAASLLTDIRRSTVGPGTREDLVTVPPVYALSYAATEPVVAYLVPASAVFMSSVFQLQNTWVPVLVPALTTAVLATDTAYVEFLYVLLRRLCSAVLSTSMRLVDVLGQWLSAFWTTRNERQKCKPMWEGGEVQDPAWQEFKAEQHSSGQASVGRGELGSASIH